MWFPHLTQKQNELKDSAIPLTHELKSILKLKHLTLPHLRLEVLLAAVLLNMVGRFPGSCKYVHFFQAYLHCFCLL